MIEQKYLIDNNALGALGARRRGSDFFRTRCRVTEDVVHEARFTVRGSALAGVTQPVTPAILKQVARVMATVPVGDTSLLDLFANKGAADPLLVATALALNEQESLSLLGDEWIIVTLDRAVVAKAKEFEAQTATPGQLAAIIDAAGVLAS